MCVWLWGLGDGVVVDDVAAAAKDSEKRGVVERGDVE